jgi:hypothetical protein
MPSPPASHPGPAETVELRVQPSAASRWRWPAAYNIVLALLFAGALVVGWAVLPGEDERIEALERDGQTSRALALLEARFARGDRRQRTLATLKRFYEYYGDTPKTLAVLQLLIEQRPRDMFLYRQLVQLYRQAEDEPGQISALKAQLSIRYSEPVCQRLIGLLRLSSAFDQERVVLAECRANGYRRQEDLERLAFLYAADGDLTASAQILAAVDDRRWLRGSRERLMLFEALLATQAPADAVRRGVRWYRGQPNPDFALEMIAKLIAAERSDLGLQMANELGKPGDPVLLAAAEILVDQVQYRPAQLFLTGWLAQARDISLETAARFVTAAVDAEAPALALRGAETFGLTRFRPEDLVGLGEALMGAGQTDAFDKVRAALPAATIAGAPLLSAAVDLREGRPDAARATLATAVIDPQDERRGLLKARLSAMAARPSPATVAPALVRDPAKPEILLVPPLSVSSPSESQSRRISVPVEVARRFKKRREAYKAAAPPLTKTRAPSSQLRRPGNSGNTARRLAIAGFGAGPFRTTAAVAQFQRMPRVVYGGQV